MAGLNVIQTPSQKLSTGTTNRKTLLQYTAPASSGGRVKRAGISFDGTSPTAGKIEVFLGKGISGGTATTRNPQKVSGHTGSVQGSGKEDYSSEPTGNVDIKSVMVHPQSGYDCNLDVVLNPGETFFVACKAPSAVNAWTWFEIEE